MDQLDRKKTEAAVFSTPAAGNITLKNQNVGSLDINITKNSPRKSPSPVKKDADTNFTKETISTIKNFGS